MNLSDTQLKLLIKYLCANDRNARHLSAIEDALIQMEFFQKLKNKNHLKQLQQCWKIISYMKLTKGQTVFYKGAWPKEFYVILKGEVSILISKDQKTLNLEKEENKHISKEIQSKIFASEGRHRQIVGVDKKLKKVILIPQIQGISPIQIADTFSSDDGESDADQQEIQYYSPSHLRKQSRLSDRRVSALKPTLISMSPPQGVMMNQIDELDNKLTINDLEEPEMYYDSGTFKYKQINTLSSGTQFGETGLVLLQGRTATVLCLQDCHFATLSKEHFDKIFLEILHTKFIKKAQSIQKSLGLNLPFNLMIPISNCFHKVVQHLGTYLFVEGDEAKDIYVIKKGEVQLLKAFKDPHLDQVKKVELMKSQKGFLQNHFIKLAIYGQEIMVGHEDIITNKLRSFTIQVTSSKATLYVTDKYQFKTAIAEISSFQKNQIHRNIEEFQNQLKDKLIKFKEISDLASKTVEAHKTNKKARVLRTSVLDIDKYLDNKNKSNVIEVKETYGADKMDKLDMMQSLLDSFPVQQELDNDEYIQAFDKAGIERKLRKLRLRRKILTRGNVSKADEEKFNNMLKLRGPSTREKITLLKSIESGEYRAASTANKKNLPWELIFARQQEDKYRMQSQPSNLVDEQTCITEPLANKAIQIEKFKPDSLKFLQAQKFLASTSQDSIVFQQNTYMIRNQFSGTSQRKDQSKDLSKSKDQTTKTRPHTSISRKLVTRTTNEAFYMSTEPKLRKDTSFINGKLLSASINHINLTDHHFASNPVFDFNRKEERPDQKYHYLQREEVPVPIKIKTTSSRNIIQSNHNLYRFGSPKDVQRQLIKKRFDNKK